VGESGMLASLKSELNLATVTPISRQNTPTEISYNITADSILAKEIQIVHQTKLTADLRTISMDQN